MNYEERLTNVINGEEDALILLAELKVQKNIIDGFIKEVEPIAMEEANSYEEKKFDLKGWTFEKRSGGKMYDFSHIPEWVETKDILKDIEERSKQAYSCYVKGIQVATDDGEEIHLPIVKNRKDSIITKPSNTK